MALKDHYRPAKLLDSMSWIQLPEKVRNARLAHGYIEAEDDIKGRCRKYDGPSTSTVSVYVKSCYRPPHGSGKHVFEAVRQEILRQKRIRAKRLNNRPYKHTMAYSKLIGFSKTARKRDRMRAVSTQLFTIRATGYRKQVYTVDHNIIGMGRVDDTLFIVHRGGHRNDTIIYMHDRRRGIEKAVAVKRTPAPGDNVYDVLLKLVTGTAGCALLSGGTIKLDVVNECSIVNGVPFPWKIKHSYPRNRLHKIKNQWQKDDD